MDIVLLCSSVICFCCGFSLSIIGLGLHDAFLGFNLGTKFFGKFAEALEKTQKRVNAAAEELDTLVGTRTRKMNSKLRSIEALDEETSKLLIDGSEEE